MSSSTATLSLPEGATVVATLPPSALPRDLVTRYGATGGYLLLVAPEKSEPQPATGGVQVDTDRRLASVDGEPLDLTYLEFELLAHLIAHPHRVHTRDHLVSVVWGYGHVGDGRTVDVHVARLRRKLGSAHRGGIVTVRRVGYKYVPIG
jgi:DNA-binding response OmpR family regulator